MPQCKARIFSDDPAVTLDMNHHIAGARRVPDVLQCVWPEGHDKQPGGGRVPQHHSSASGVWDGPAEDLTIPSPEEKAARMRELEAELQDLKGGK